MWQGNKLSYLVKFPSYSCRQVYILLMALCRICRLSPITALACLCLFQLMPCHSSFLYKGHTQRGECAHSRPSRVLSSAFGSVAERLLAELRGPTEPGCWAATHVLQPSVPPPLSKSLSFHHFSLLWGGEEGQLVPDAASGSILPCKACA